MKIKMLSTQNGSLDGIRSSSYLADTEYDLSDSVGARSLAKAFVDAGMAVEVMPPDLQTAQQEQPATAGFFTPIEGQIVSPSMGAIGESDGTEPFIQKAFESAPENKMIKRAYNRKAK